MLRDTISYVVGDERDPGNPFGRCRLVIQIDGQTTLDHYSRSAHKAWKGTIAAGALDQLWNALEEGKFPYTPPHPMPGGSSARDLKIGVPTGRSAYFAFHAVAAMPGYNRAFQILDNTIRQLSGDTVKLGRADGEKIVDAIEPIPA